ncbi:14 kDa phosphohistidine phosphatase [Geodia barretti]|uniref:14 kDa phosphohistidine phosphatase n=1 Tax=Geodia barretti TaxID=519541 RepID=A0AA35U3J9_GEOBA|nr:14 kDa phosphohistidine phosphatase [Geodia barretti]
MDQVADVDIESDGVYKYILIKVSDKKSSASKMVVRGYSWADYHADILDRVSPKFHRLGLTYECLGGGRIDHNSRDKLIKIYGYSVVS